MTNEEALKIADIMARTRPERRNHHVHREWVMALRTWELTRASLLAFCIHNTENAMPGFTSQWLTITRPRVGIDIH